MPDSNLADGAVLTSTFYNTYIREQVVVTCTSATRPTGVEGRICFESDTERLMIYSGSAWNLLGSSGWVTFTPSWTNITVGNGTNSGRYRYVDGGIRVQASFTLGSTSSVTGTVTLTVPNSETHATGTVSVGSAIVQDLSTRTYVAAASIGSGATAINIYHSESGNLGEINGTNPFTFGTGDGFYVDIAVRLA